MASSPSSSAAISLPNEYDVFLSFSGRDTRKTFTGHLHAALLRKKLETYIDDKLERGYEIGPALLEAISKSRLSVIIFSNNYASSTWCLDELVHILGCKERDGQFVIPIFYDIDPSHVRKQLGNYADAFAKLEERFKGSIDKVDKWRAAVTEAANLSGFDYSKKTETEANFIEKVVQDILTKLNCKSSSDIKGLVGIESRIEEIELLLCIDSPDVCTVGIWGMGGIGKTTLADAVYHCLSSKFEACCFLPNVRENSEEKDGLYKLRNKLLRELLDDEKLDIQTPSIGPDLLKRRLLCTKVLIVLDDVNDSGQLDVLLGNDVQFGPGSRIIITSRDRHVLRGRVDDEQIYKVKGLKGHEALELFHLHAFKNKSRTTNYTELSRNVVDYVKGIPLALKVLGSLFLPCNTEEDWKNKLEKLKRFPNEAIQNVFRLSYNGLGENEQEIFLDIACFYKGMGMDDVKKKLDLHDLCADGIGDLIDRSLIFISEGDCLEMHDLLQEMGRTIVREQCREEPGNRDRLWAAEDACHVLENNTGSATLQHISFNASKISRLKVCGSAFKKMYNLRLLEIFGTQYSHAAAPKFMRYLYRAVLGKECYSNLDLSEGLESLPNALTYLYWDKYPLKSLPSNFSPQNLVELRMPHSNVEALWNKRQNLANLKLINLSYSKRLTRFPDLSRSLKIEHIDLSGCARLERIPAYFKNFDKLTHLNLAYSNIKFIPEMPRNIKVLELERTAIKELPTSSIKFLFGLTTLRLGGCKLTSLPMSICKLKSLETLVLRGCSNLKYFPEILEPMEHLVSLDLSATAVKELPSSIEKLSGLVHLYLAECKDLQFVPNNICSLNRLKFLSFKGCSKLKKLTFFSVGLCSLEQLYLDGCLSLEEISDHLFCLPSLQTLDLAFTNIESVPASIKEASQLSSLHLDCCRRLQSLPELPLKLDYLDASNCTSLKKVSSSSTAFAQGLEKYGSFRVALNFANCLNLDGNARSNIMADAQLRYMQAAFRTEQGNYNWNRVSIVCWGNEIPNWFTYQNEGSSITIELPRDCLNSDFLCFALSFVVVGVDFSARDFSVRDFHVRCNIKINEGESDEFMRTIYVYPYIPTKASFKSHNLIVWYYSIQSGKAKRSAVTEASIRLCVQYEYNAVVDFDFEVERCGICLINAQDAEIKLAGNKRA